MQAGHQVNAVRVEVRRRVRPLRAKPQRRVLAAARRAERAPVHRRERRRRGGEELVHVLVVRVADEGAAGRVGKAAASRLLGLRPPPVLHLHRRHRRRARVRIRLSLWLQLHLGLLLLKPAAKLTDGRRLLHAFGLPHGPDAAGVEAHTHLGRAELGGERVRRPAASTPPVEPPRDHEWFGAAERRRRRRCVGGRDATHLGAARPRRRGGGTARRRGQQRGSGGGRGHQRAAPLGEAGEQQVLRQLRRVVAERHRE